MLRGTIDFSGCKAEARERFLLPIAISYPASTAAFDCDAHLSPDAAATALWRALLQVRRCGRIGQHSAHYRALASIPPGLKLEDLPDCAVVTGDADVLAALALARLRRSVRARHPGLWAGVHSAAEVVVDRMPSDHTPRDHLLALVHVLESLESNRGLDFGAELRLAREALGGGGLGCAKPGRS